VMCDAQCSSLSPCIFHRKGLEGDFLDDQTVEKIPRQAV
jgi:hypothetical protein